MLKKRLMISALILLLLSSCASVEKKTSPNMLIRPELDIIETDNGTVLEYNREDPRNPITRHTERGGVYFPKESASDLLIYIAGLESSVADE